MNNRLPKVDKREATVASLDESDKGRPRTSTKIALAHAQVSRQISRRLPYYLTPEEAHRIIDGAQSQRDQLFLRLLWETGLRVSEAISVRLGDVGREGIRVVGKGGVDRVVFV